MRLEEDIANIREASAQPDLAARFLAALRFFWVKRGYVAEGRRLVEDVLPHLPDHDPAKPMALATGTLLAVMQGDWDLAVAHGERGGELAVAAGDELTRLELASMLGRALLAVGEEQRALALFTEAAARGVEVGRPSLAAIALLNLGYLALVRGEPGTAREHFERSCELARRLEDGHVIARSLGPHAHQPSRLAAPVHLKLRRSARASAQQASGRLVKSTAPPPL